MLLKVTHIVNSIFSSRTYILSCDECGDVWLVDCGDIEKLPNDINVVGVLLTHAHFDHIYGLPTLLQRFPTCKIATNPTGLDTLSDAKKNMSKYHETPITISPLHPIICTEGDTIELFPGITAKIYETPGHHPSCLTYDVGEYLFTGDAYIPNVTTITNLPGGNKPQAEQSKLRILSFADGKTICPGHEV